MQQLFIDNRDGFGPRDFTKFLMDSNQFFKHTKNEPQLFEFNVVMASGVSGWVIPKRGAYVRFIDDRWQRKYAGMQDGVLYTGYVTEEPDLIFLGKDAGNEAWGYSVKTTSDEYLANIKKLPNVTYVNKTRGFILVDLLRRMFEDSSVFPFDAAGVTDGGTEQLYQVETQQTWSEVASTFATADGFSYWVLDSYLFYGPDAVPLPSGDPKLVLNIDADDPRYTPDNLDLRRLTRTIVNDATVFGEDEPADVVEEHFVSDGYQGFHDLAFVPYGITESVLLDDDFTGDVDTGIWEEKDTGSDYIQVFDGALNVTGGPGTDTGTVYLRAKRPIDMSGVISIRDGEIYFPPSPTGVGYVGGLYIDDQVKLASLWCGWKLDITNRQIIPYGPGSGLITASTYAFLPTRHYVLRRTLQTTRQVSQNQGFASIANGTITHFLGPVNSVCRITWEIQEINTDDPANVLINNTIVATETAVNVPDYLFYVVTAPDSCHYVSNFTTITKPQQAILLVNGKVNKLGKFLDGARAAMQDEAGKGKLAWYATPQSTDSSILSYSNAVLGDGPEAYWRLDETSGTSRTDSSNNVHTGTAAAGVTQNVTGALNNDDGLANRFTGASNSYITGAGFLMSSFYQGSVEYWFKTSSAAFQTIFSTVDSGSIGEAYSIGSGQLSVSTNLGGFVSVRTGLHDGRWHHVVVTYNDAGTCKLYIDGVLDKTTSLARPGVVNTWYISRNIGYEATHGGTPANFIGDLDEIAIYFDIELTAAAVKSHYDKASTGGYGVTTIPAAGSTISLQYFRKRPARARVKYIESIKAERERYLDDGARQKVYRSGDISPTPRTSQECLALAKAIVLDAADAQFEGSYRFDTVTGTVTELRLWPKPGDIVSCRVRLASLEYIEKDLTIQTVESTFLGNEAYEISLGFGPINRFDKIIRDLILKRKSSVDDPVLADNDVDTVEALDIGYPYPDDLTSATVTSITATAFTISVPLPGDVVNYEVRTDDTGWGQPNYIDRFHATTRTFTRPKRDLLYYIRPYNSDGIYARISAVIRVACPTNNNITITGVTGDISTDRVRVIVPIPRDPDYGGIIVRHNNSTGDVVYQGNGDQNLQLARNVTVLASAGKLSIDIPNIGYVDNGTSASYQVWVNTYNLLGLIGTAQTLMVSAAASGAWANKAFDALDFTASAGNWTLTSGDQITFASTLVEDTMALSLDLQTTTVTATPSSLKVKIPGGYKASLPSAIVCVLVDNGTRVTGIMSVAAGSADITIKRFDNANFATSTNNTSVTGSFTFPITKQ
jgi:hypothetical protein